MNDRNLTVGQTVYLVPGGNAWYYHGKRAYIPAKVEKIAKKYVYVNYGSSSRSTLRFLKDTLEFDREHSEDCNMFYTLYFSEDEIRRVKERSRQIQAIRDAFQCNSAVEAIAGDDIQKIYDVLVGCGVIKEES